MDKLLVFSFICVSLAAATEKVCQKNPADIVFILDESGSIWGPDFRDRQLPFVIKLVNMFAVRPNMTRIGLLTFSDGVKPYFHLKTYKNKKDIEDAVKAIRQRRGGTNTFKALKFLREQSFSKKNGARKGVAKIGIILSDGESSSYDKTVREANLVKKANITLFAVAVGVSQRGSKQRKLEKELKDIASDPVANYFPVEDFSKLDEIKKNLTISVCEVTTLPPPTTTTTVPTTTLPQMIEGCRGRYTIDAVFALSEYSVPSDTIAAIDFVKSLAEDAEISPEKIQVGLVPSTCEARDGIKLNECPSRQKLMDELEKRKPSGSYPVKALKTLQTSSFGEAEGGRSEAVKFAIVFIDARIGNAERVIKQAEKTKDGRKLIIVGVGKEAKADEDVLKEMATSDSHYFYVSAYSQLKKPKSNFKKDLKKLLCDGVKNGDPSAGNIHNIIEEEN